MLYYNYMKNMIKTQNNIIIYTLIILAVLLLGVISLPANASAQSDNGYELRVKLADTVEENVTPTIFSLNPNPVILGSGTKEVTIHGEGFARGSVAKLDGSDRTTTFINSNTLRFDLVNRDTSSVGNATVRVYSPNGGLSNGYTFSVTRKLEAVSGSTSASQNQVPPNAGNTNKAPAKASTTTPAKNTNTSSNSLDTGNEGLGQLAAGAIFGDIGFLPSGIIQWIIFAILVLMLVIIARKLFAEDKYHQSPLKHA